MKKQYGHKDLSAKLCADCGKPMKLNLVTKNPAARYCFKCFKTIKEK
jgi:RNA polymerase-binding transcription factor DksA